MVYLDYAATTPMLPEVIKAVADAERRFYGNASALHTPGHLANNAIEKARELLAILIGAEPDEVIFTSCASESNNTVVRTFAGCEIETSPLEHHSVLEVAKLVRGAGGPGWPKLYSYMLANNETGEFLKLPEIDRTEIGVYTSVYTGGVDVVKNTRTGVNEKGRKNIGGVKNTEAGVGQQNNARSANTRVWDLFEAKDEWGHDLVKDRRREYLHSDLTQVLGKIPIDVKKLGLDYATFSAHKIGGPLGVGALYVRKGVPLRPLIIGGLQERERRGGTYNTPGIVGFGTAVERVLEEKPWEKIDTGVRALRDMLARRILAEIPGASLNTPIEGLGEGGLREAGKLTPSGSGAGADNVVGATFGERGETRAKGGVGADNVAGATFGGHASLPNILNVSFKAAEGESIQLYLDAEGIIVSTGSACAAGDTKPSHVLMAKTGDAEMAHSSIRFSFGVENTMRDVERVMKVLPGVVERLQGMSTIG